MTDHGSPAGGLSAKPPAWARRRPRLGRLLNLIVLVAGASVALWKSGAATGRDASTRLRITVRDRASGRPVPARVELLDAQGQGYVAEDALPVGGDPKDREARWTGTVQDALAQLSPAVKNPYTRTVQFYSPGSCRVVAPPGKYRLTVAKGFEYEIASREVDVVAGQDSEVDLSIGRWADLKSRGWYGADGHLHIARPLPELDPLLSKWMQGEDIAVATLLQWGHLGRFHNTLQHSLGRNSVYRDGDYLLASGQESPRTHLLGHTITWGASKPIDFFDGYILYRLFWEESRRQRAVSGYAHYGLAAGALNGLSIDLPLGLLSFLEVLQFNRGSYDVWYNILDSGFRMAPTAGTDYPFGGVGLPGSERFYTKVEGPLDYEKWLEGVRRGRTFVTNGPLLEFRVEDREIGDEMVLPRAGRVRVAAAVSFDPKRDAVERLEVISSGEVVRTVAPEAGRSRIEARFDWEVREATWLAVRVSGSKTGIAVPVPSLAHSGAIWVRVAGAPDLREQPRARALARGWVTRLEELEHRLGSEIESMGISGWDDDLPADYLRKNRPALVEAIQSAKKHFRDQAR